MLIFVSSRLKPDGILQMEKKYSTLFFSGDVGWEDEFGVSNGSAKGFLKTKLGRAGAYTACGPFPPLLRRTQCRYILESLGAILC